MASKKVTPKGKTYPGPLRPLQTPTTNPPKPAAAKALPPRLVKKVTVGSDLDYSLKKKYSMARPSAETKSRASYVSSFKDVVSEGEIRVGKKLVPGTSRQAQAAAGRVAGEAWDKMSNYYSAAKIPTNKRSTKSNLVDKLDKQGSGFFVAPKRKTPKGK